MDLVIRVARECLNLTPVGVKFCFTDNPNLDAYRPHESRRYCEWVGEVMKTSREVLLNGENISCLAAREILGLTGCEESHGDECLKELVREGRFTSKETALRALMGIPRMERKPRNILLSSRTISPDVYVFYLSPKHFMMMTQAYQRATGEELRLDVSSVMPVCGNCTVRPYVTDRICASFGCVESRTYGMITDDKFVVGMPVGNAASVTRSLMEMMNRS